MFGIERTTDPLTMASIATFSLLNGSQAQWVTLWVAFLLLHLDLAILIALVIALIDALPILGSGIVLLPWAAVAALTAMRTTTDTAGRAALRGTTTGSTSTTRRRPA